MTTERHDERRCRWPASVGPHATGPSLPISFSSNSPEANTAGMASRNEYRAAASRV